MNENKYVIEVLQDRIDWLKQLMEESAKKGVTSDRSIRQAKIAILEQHIKQVKEAEEGDIF